MSHNAEDRALRHLEFIQSTITRLNSNSFSAKGWTAAILSALLALLTVGSQLRSPWVVAAAVPPVLAMWYLDACYLSLERAFRGLYTAVANGLDTADPAVCPPGMTMDHKPYKTSWLSAAFSGTVCVFYIMMLAMTVIVGLLLVHLR